MGGQGSQFPMPFWLQLVCTPQHYKVGLAFMQLESAQAALDVNGDLEHPLLDRITECSARPTEAMQFFTLLFWPVAERLVEKAQWHVYIYETFKSLKASAPKEDASTSEGVQVSGRE